MAALAPRLRLLPAYAALSRSVAAIVAAAGLGLFLWGAYIPAKGWLAQILLEQAWDRARKTHGAAHGTAQPWPWADMTPVARLSVDRLGAQAIVLAGASGSSLAFGPGHVDGTALPGEPGHSVVSAHRDTHFAFLQDTRIGDRIRVERPGGGEVTYRIVEQRVIDTRKEQVVLHPEADVLTLITCFPFTDWTPGGPLRLIVTAER